MGSPSGPIRLVVVDVVDAVEPGPIVVVVAGVEVVEVVDETGDTPGSVVGGALVVVVVEGVPPGGSVCADPTDDRVEHSAAMTRTAPTALRRRERLRTPAVADAAVSIVAAPSIGAQSLTGREEFQVHSFVIV